MSRINPNPPRSQREIEEFFLEVRNKLKNTSTTMEELDQRSNWPGASIAGEFDRELKSLAFSVLTPMRAQISELERVVFKLQGERAVLNATISELERRIDSIEKSARF